MGSTDSVDWPSGFLLPAGSIRPVKEEDQAHRWHSCLQVGSSTGCLDLRENRTSRSEVVSRVSPSIEAVCEQRTHEGWRTCLLCMERVGQYPSAGRGDSCGRSRGVVDSRGIPAG